MVAFVLLEHAQPVEGLPRRVRYMRFQSWMPSVRAAQLHVAELDEARLPDHHDLQSALQLGPHHRRERRALRQFEAAPLFRGRFGPIRFETLAAVTWRHVASKVSAKHRQRQIASSLEVFADDSVVPKSLRTGHQVTDGTFIPMRREAFKAYRLAQVAPIVVTVQEEPAMDLAAAGRELDDRSKTMVTTLLGDLLLAQRSHGHARDHKAPPIVELKKRPVPEGLIIYVAMEGRVTVINARGGFFFVRTNEAKVFFAHRDHLLGGRAVFERIRVSDWVSFDAADSMPRANLKPRALNIKHYPSSSAAAKPPAVLSSASLPQENEQ